MRRKEKLNFASWWFFLGNPDIPDSEECKYPLSSSPKTHSFCPQNQKLRSSTLLTSGLRSLEFQFWLQYARVSAHTKPMH